MLSNYSDYNNLIQSVFTMIIFRSFQSEITYVANGCLSKKKKNNVLLRKDTLFTVKSPWTLFTQI